MAATTVSTAAPTTDKPPRPRRWIPLSLRMVVVVLVVSAIWNCEIIRRRQNALRAVERAEGRVQRTPSGPPWLREFLGEPTMELFDGVRIVDLRFCEGIELDSIDFACFDRLERLLLGETEIGDEELLRLKAPVELRSLSLYGLDRVTDRGLARIASFRELEDLELNGTSITDAGLEQLKGLRNLRDLCLDDTRISSAAIADLKASLPKLIVYKDGKEQ